MTNELSSSMWWILRSLVDLASMLACGGMWPWAIESRPYSLAEDLYLVKINFYRDNVSLEY